MPQHSEDLRPALIRASKSDAASLLFTAFGRDFRVELSNNPRLNRLAAGSSTQFYQGVLEGVPGSWARITVQHGLPRGMIWDGQELFIVEESPEAVNDGAAGTVMFKLSDAVMERGVSLRGDEVETPRAAAEAYDAMVGELRPRMQALQAGGATQGLEISILADAALLARFASESEARDAILTRLNNVEGIFSAQLGVELQVVSVDLANERTGSLTATTNSSALLEELGQLRRRTGALSATGLTHLFTGRELDGDTAGVAYTVSLCSPRYAASLTMVHNSSALDALITAHEIGHVFGAPHDGVKECSATPQGEYIMTPTLDTSVTSFSQCSLEQINEVIDSYSCLVALPPPGPDPPAPPPSGNGSGDGGGGGGDGGDGNSGGGALDTPLLALLLLLAGVAARNKGGARRVIRGSR